MNILKSGQGPLQIIWAHGWGMSARALSPMAASFNISATNYLPDFHGHGQTPLPPAPWGSAEYANATTTWLRTLPRTGKRIWVGHSFGCRVGLQIAANHPDLLDGLVLIGPAGLPRKRSIWQRLNNFVRVRTFKTLKFFVPEGPKRDALRARFGSPDYRRAGALRPSFLRVISEDLTPQAATITLPTLIICGAKDTETPPELAQRLHNLITGSTLHILKGHNHYTVLDTAKHQIASLINRFIQTNLNN